MNKKKGTMIELFCAVKGRRWGREGGNGWASDRHVGETWVSHLNTSTRTGSTKPRAFF